MSKSYRQKLPSIFIASSFCVLLFVPSLIFAAGSLDEGILELSHAMIPQAQRLGQKRIAVVDFTDIQGRVTILGRFIAEELSTSLVLNGSGIRVVDRQHLAKIIQEQKLSIYGIVNPQAVKRLGQLAGADALVVGSTADLGDSVRITAKILGTTTAEIIGAAATTVPKAGAVERLLIEEPAQNRPSGTTPQPPSIALPLTDAFNIRPNPGWRVLSGQWIVRDGAYGVAEATRGAEAISVIGNKNWINYAVEVDVRLLGDWTGEELAILLRVQDRSNFVRLHISQLQHAIFWIVRENGIDSSPLGLPHIRIFAPAIHVRLQARGAEYVASIDGASTSFSFPEWTTGSVGLMIKMTNQNYPLFRNFSVVAIP